MTGIPIEANGSEKVYMFHVDKTTRKVLTLPLLGVYNARGNVLDFDRRSLALTTHRLLLSGNNNYDTIFVDELLYETAVENLVDKKSEEMWEKAIDLLLNKGYAKHLTSNDQAPQGYSPEEAELNLIVARLGLGELLEVFGEQRLVEIIVLFNAMQDKHSREVAEAEFVRFCMFLEIAEECGKLPFHKTYIQSPVDSRQLTIQLSMFLSAASKLLSKLTGSADVSMDKIQKLISTLNEEFSISDDDEDDEDDDGDITEPVDSN